MTTKPETAAGQSATATRTPAGGLLRTRNFGLFWAGESISGFGSAITTVALPLVAVSTLHASTGMVALLTAATWLPWLLIGLPAGTWVDRWPRRRTLLAADLASATVLAAVPVAAWTGVLTVSMLLAAALVAGTSSVFFSLAFNAYLPHLLAADDRLEASARLQTSAAAAQVAGPWPADLDQVPYLRDSVCQDADAPWIQPVAARALHEQARDLAFSIQRDPAEPLAGLEYLNISGSSTTV